MSALRVVLILFLFLFASGVEARDKVWSAVVVANSVAKPKPAPAELKAVAARLHRVFGCNQFEIVGHATTEIDDDTKTTLKPTKTFWLDLQARRISKPDARGGYLLGLKLHHDERVLVDTVALIAKDSPLFFRGPMCPRGQVLVVLQVQP
ncbi:MAG: hypothetical protein ABMA13_12950 [Chthoniobacteraceae bacterium]